MTSYYVFDTQAAALEACATIDTVMGYPCPKGQTMRWAVPQQRATDNKWIVQVPPVDVAVGAETEHYEPAWNGTEDEGQGDE